MKLNPTQAPLYGDCVLTVSLTEQRELEDDAAFYLLFAGSTLKHLASARKVDAATLETVTPGHDCCEQVKVLLFISKKGLSAIVAQEDFEFIKDEAYESAQFLASSVGNQQALLFAKFFLNKSKSTPRDAVVLDKKITLAFRHLRLPSGWNVLGESSSITDAAGQETLLHFAARLGLCALSKFLLEQPGGRTSLAIPNSDGATPVTLALERGFLKLHQLLTEADPQKIDLGIENSHVEQIGEFWVKHHYGLNVYTLTKKFQVEANDNMEDNIKELRDYIQSHSLCPGTDVKTQQETMYDGDGRAPYTGSAVDSQASIGVLQGDAKPCGKSDNELETVGGDVTSFSRDLEPKEEEEGSECIVKAENTSVTQKPICPTEAQAAENLLSGGNTNEETGMTSTGIVLDLKSLCGSGNADEEMIGETESKIPEAAHKVADLSQDVSVNMGQSVSGYCTGASDTTDTTCPTGSSEQEALKGPLYRDNQSSEITKEPSTCLGSESTHPCNGQRKSVSDGKEECDSQVTSHHRTLEKFAENLVLSVVDGVLAMGSDYLNGGDLGLKCGKDVEKVADNLTASIISASLVELEVTSAAETSNRTGEEPQEEVLSELAVKDLMSCDAEVPVTTAENTTPDVLVNSSQDSFVLSDNDEIKCIENKVINITPSETSVAELTLSGEEESDLQNVTEPASEDAGPKKQETLPPAGATVSLQKGDGTCAKLHKASDTPSPFNNYENQEVLQVDSDHIDASAEMQEAAVTAGSEPSAGHRQPTNGDGGNDTGLVEEDAVGLPLLGQSANVDYKLPAENGDACKKEVVDVEDDGGEEDSDVVQVPRASLHSIAEETLPNGESSSDSASSEDTASSDISDTEKSIGTDEEQTVDPFSKAVDCLSDEEGAVTPETPPIASNGDMYMVDVTPATQVTPSITDKSFQSTGSYGKGPCGSPHVLKEDDSGLDLSVNLEDTMCPSISDTEIVSECLDNKADDDEVDFGKPQLSPKTKEVSLGNVCAQINRENCCSLTPCPHPVLLEKQANDTKECNPFLEESLQAEHSSPHTPKSDLASDYMSSEVLDEMIFSKLEDEQSMMNASSSGSEDTSSLERTSSHGSDLSLSRALAGRKHRDLDSNTKAASGKIRKSEETGMSEIVSLVSSNVTEVSENSVQSRSTVRSLSPSRRHSWEPGKHKGNDTDINHRCHSLEGLAVNAMCSQEPSSRLSGSHLREERGSLTSLTEEEQVYDQGIDRTSECKLQEEQLLGNRASFGSEDTCSLERTSSHGSDSSISRSLIERKDSNPLTPSMRERVNEKPGVSENEGEEMDRITDVSPHAIRSRSTIRSLSPFRRHSWEPGKHKSSNAEINRRSYSLEGLAENNPPGTHESSFAARKSSGGAYKGEDRGSLTSLTEEEQEPDQRTGRSSHQVACERSEDRDLVYSESLGAPRLSKSMSLTAIGNTLAEGSRSLNISSSSSLAQSISEECSTQLPPSPSQKDLEGKGVTKVSRTFSYIRNKMSSGKKTKEKDKEKTKDKEKEPNEKSKEKHKSNGHIFITASLTDTPTCKSCDKPFTKKPGYVCQECGLAVHRGCRDVVDSCTKIKEEKVMQPPGPVTQTVVMRNKGSQPKERPRSAIVAVDEKSLMTLGFNARRPQTLSISKSISTQNISGLGRDDNLLGSLRALSQSTDSLHKASKVESLESLSDEGADLYEGQLMGEFEMDSRQLEKASWSEAVDNVFLVQQMKDVVKRQDVIYELMQTEMHHILRLKIMSDIYCQGMSSELQYEQQVIEKIFPCMEDLLNIHSQFFQRMLERKKESMAEKSEKNFVIRRIGDICLHQFSGENAERMVKTYGKFCGHHKEALDYFKDLLSKDKRFQAFVKKKSSSPLVRRMGIPECLLLVTQRITKYPIILERILHYTEENEGEHQSVTHALSLVKEVLNGVNNKVKNYEMKKRLNEIYSKTDSKSIQRMKSGQMFAKEDLKRRKFVRDGPVFLRSNQTSRSKEALAVLLSDVLVFLQEKDQKYVFASLEQKSTVISLKNLIVREVAHDEKGLFLISMVGKDPELVEVLASTKEERNSWIETIKETAQTMDKDEDEGVQSESEEEKRNWDAKAKELKEQLQQKDDQIITLLEEKEKIFLTLVDGSSHERNFSTAGRILFRANTEEAPKGETLIKSAIKEVETLQVLLNQNLWSSIVQQAPSPADLEAGLGSVSLPRRAETFGGFDSHQLNASKSGEKDEGEDAQDLRRTESDSVLKKGVSPSVMLKRNGEHVLQTVSNLHKLLSSLQAVVLQQDTFIEHQKLRLSEKRPITRTTSKPKSFTEQEKVEQLLQDIVKQEKQQTEQQVPLPQEKPTRDPLMPGSTESLKRVNSIAPKQEHLDSKTSAVSKKDTLSRTESKQKGKGHFSLLGSQTNKPAEGPATNRLFNLSKTKDKKEKKKKSKGNHCPSSDTVLVEGVSQDEEIFC